MKLNEKASIDWNNYLKPEEVKIINDIIINPKTF